MITKTIAQTEGLYSTLSKVFSVNLFIRIVFVFRNCTILLSQPQMSRLPLKSVNGKK